MEKLLLWMVARRCRAAEEWKWPLMHILPKKFKTQRQMAGQSSCLAPTDPVAPPMSVGQLQQQNEPTEAERKLHRLVRRNLRVWTRRRRKWTQPGSPSQRWQDQDEGYPILVVQCDYFFFKAVNEDKLLAPSCGRWSVSSKV